MTKNRIAELDPATETETESKTRGKAKGKAKAKASTEKRSASESGRTKAAAASEVSKVDKAALLNTKSRWTKASNDPIDLWKAYKADPCDGLRNRLIEHYLPIVRYTAERLGASLPQSVDVEDLMSAGLFGLMESIKNFDLERGVKFKTFCSWRVRGAILDDLRANDWVPRLVRTKATKLEHKMREAEAQLGRPATDLELASMLGISLGELDQLMRDASAVSVCYLSDTSSDNQDGSSRSDFLEDPRSRDPIHDLQRKDIMEVLTRELSLRERLIVILYYFEELTMREIGLTLDLSESRVCQLHSRIIVRLKDRLGRRKDELAV
jgi:RNA polymerase sigma factor FliA